MDNVIKIRLAECMAEQSTIYCSIAQSIEFDNPNLDGCLRSECPHYSLNKEGIDPGAIPPINLNYVVVGVAAFLIGILIGRRL